MTEHAAEPLLKTKLFIPQVRHEVVKRSRLISRMNAGIQRALTLVSAPAGFGKTTALAEWADQLQVPVAWVSLDEDDNDLARFFTYLTAALQTALPGAGEAALMAFRSPQPPPVESALTELINEIAAGTVSFALVLDDYHVIKARPVHDAIAFLIEHMPAQMHLVIATRTDPPLPLARLRGRMQLAELRATDLRFTTDEVAAFLNQVMGLNLSGDDVAALEARTEGWIVGLQLAALSMQGREDIPGFIAAFTGSHHYVLDYLAEEVLHRQPENVQTFLLHTSILDRLCGPLCDALLDDGGHTRDNSRPSQAMLEYMEQSNLFIVSLDDERKWYRYHHLFADLLRTRLTQSYGDQHVGILHTRAAGWYEANGFPAEAIQHALAAQDYDRAARVIENISESAWLNGEFYRLLGWIEALPGELIRHRPWLCIWYTWALLQSGLVQEVEALINDVERMSENQLRDQPAKPSPDTQALMDQIVTLQVISASCLRQDPGKTIELASQALERSPVENRMTSFIARCEVLYNLGFAYYLTGELSKAEQTYQEAKRAARQIGFLLRDILVTHKLAHIHQVIGRLHQPYHLYQETLAFMQKQGKEEFFGMGYLYCGMSNLLYEWNRLEEAQQMVAESLRLNEMAQVPHLLVDSYNAQARLLITQRDLVAAQTALQKAADLIQKYYCWPEVIGANESYQVRLWLAKGDLTSAIRWAQGRQLADLGSA